MVCAETTALAKRFITENELLSMLMTHGCALVSL